MLIYPHINPVAIALGPIKVHWYGLMYLFGFLFFVYAGRWRVTHYKYTTFNNKMIDDFLFYGVLGVILGGRLGYCIFYQASYYLSQPLDVFKIWDGGMSFHGGLIGVVVVMMIFARKNKLKFFQVSDFVAPLVPFGLLCGRIGNFINGELWGRVTDSTLPWMMVFPESGTMQPRHPSQIYEAGLEGVALLGIMWVYARQPRKLGQVSGVFAISYGVFRFILESFRQPDNLPFANEVFNQTGISLGQFYSLPLIIAGLVMLYAARNGTIYDRQVEIK